MLAAMWTNFLSHWKTTAQAFLGFLIVTGVTVQLYLSSNFATNATAIKIGSGITLALALARVWIGLLQKDAGVAIAVTAQNATPTAVSSHEVPDNPLQKVVGQK